MYRIEISKGGVRYRRSSSSVPCTICW